VLDPEMVGDWVEIDRGLQAQGTSERLPAHRQPEALGCRVQPRTPPGHPVPRVGTEDDRSTGGALVLCLIRDDSQ
jgi:hypothetical protein